MYSYFHMSNIILPIIETNNKNSTFVYVDYKPDGSPFYVGIGDFKRIKRHKRNGHHTIICNKYEGCYREIIGSFLDRTDAEELEKELIEKYGRIDLGTGLLCNKTDGGEGIIKLTPEVEKIRTEKIKNSSLLRWNDTTFQNFMQNIRDTPEYKEKHRTAVMVAMENPETIEKLSKSLQLKWDDPEFHKKMIDVFNSSDVVEKHREITTQNWNNEEYRNKVVTALNTPENKERQSNRMKEMWSNADFKQNQLKNRNTTEYKEKISKIMIELWDKEEFITKQSISRKENWNNEEYRNKVTYAINTPEAKEKRKQLSEMRKQYSSESTYNGNISKITKEMVNSYFNMGPKENV